VLDDLDVLGRRDAAIRLVASLCRQAPHRLHLMMASRADPTFLVERLRLQGQVLSISGPELACTESETGELLGMILDDDPGQLGQRLHTATAGWPAAVRLAGEALARAEPAARPGMLDRLVRTGDPVIEYFVEQVLAAEPPSVRRLVGTMAPFERFTAGMCEAIGRRRRPIRSDTSSGAACSSRPLAIAPGSRSIQSFERMRKNISPRRRTFGARRAGTPPPGAWATASRSMPCRSPAITGRRVPCAES
jgi:hypothetical protein